ncbi:hypothetical protein D9Q98_005596 [Chlorella vulgaris]|uniref:Homeobox domain-containing protein n=1 Tax=Chlorella vulgaris TaxID=3077 RepID=A0A9D4TMB4_CHLVU|nr:hypothetical protein D9Q98_005596 [Chlorella vulgaris]
MQALGRCALGPARRVGQQRAASLVVRASTDDLEDWQVTKLKQALTKGRRQVEVEKMSKDLGVPRQTVLQWLKDAPKPDPAQASLSEARAAAQQAVAERQVVLEEAQAQRQAAAPSSSTPFKGTAAAARRSGSGGSRTPVWKQYAKKKALGKQAEATLEMIFSRTQWPSDEAIGSLWELHRLPRDKVVEWFQLRRRRDQRRRGSGGSTGGAAPARDSSPAAVAAAQRESEDSRGPAFLVEYDDEDELDGGSSGDEEVEAAVERKAGGVAKATARAAVPAGGGITALSGSGSVEGVSQWDAEWQENSSEKEKKEKY